MITMIAAMSRGRVIGQNGRLPWGHGSMKHDQDRFRRLVDGQVVAIGAGTFNQSDDYIQHAKHVYLLTTRDTKVNDKITVCHSMEPVLEAAQTEQVFVVGGARVFEEFMPHADKLELTYIEADYDGDRFFPQFDEEQWRVEKEEPFPADADNRHSYKFVTLIKN